MPKFTTFYSIALIIFYYNVIPSKVNLLKNFELKFLDPKNIHIIKIAN